MICPICSGMMTEGAIRADGSRLDFITKAHNRQWKLLVLDPDAGEFCLASEYIKAAQIGASYCKKCRKLIIDDIGPSE
ncbi:MAG: PF20097 family protein [Clostridia bacterium]|nr:PF20097 family protein [Clostridia bacterium]